MKQQLVYIVLFISSVVNAQFAPESLDTALSKLPLLSFSKDRIRKIYEKADYRYLWVSQPAQQQALLSMLDSSNYYAVELNRRQTELIKAFGDNPIVARTLSDSIVTDIRLTDAAIEFSGSVGIGSKTPSFASNGLNYMPVAEDVVSSFLGFYPASDWWQVTSALEPKSIEYRNAKLLLQKWLEKTLDSSFTDVVVTSTSVTVLNTQLIARLTQLGTLTSVQNLSTPILVQALKRTQALFDVYPDGRLRTTALAAINVSLRNRIVELGLAINMIRYLNSLKKRDLTAFLNIPSASLMVYKDGKLELFSRTVVGKPATPTPVQTGLVHEVIFYPYWNVPNSIATRELLPIIKRSRNYLQANNYQVLNSGGKVVDPGTINWSALSATHFPYRLRQGTGCDNALGLVKFNFNNPFSVYLHDTPSRGLFALNKRYFSHGCMRVEKFVELAGLVLDGDEQLVKQFTDHCLRDQKPTIYPAATPLSLVVLYSTAWYNEKGEIRFFDNVYNR